jgi:AcrR family transcriptional regulator
MDQPAEAPSRLRADAARNVTRILETATRVLAEKPGAGMAEVAAAAGVARATLYRHFPTREELVATIRTQAFDDFESSLAAAGLEEGPPLEAIRRLIEVILEVGDRYLFLLAQTPGEVKGDSRLEREERMRKPVLRIIEGAQRSGELTSDLSARWGTRVLAGLIGGALRAIEQSEMSKEEAAAAAYSSFLTGFSPRA